MRCLLMGLHALIFLPSLMRFLPLSSPSLRRCIERKSSHCLFFFLNYRCVWQELQKYLSKVSSAVLILLFCFAKEVSAPFQFGSYRYFQDG